MDIQEHDENAKSQAADVDSYENLDLGEYTNTVALLPAELQQAGTTLVAVYAQIDAQLKVLGEERDQAFAQVFSMQEGPDKVSAYREFHQRDKNERDPRSDSLVAQHFEATCAFLKERAAIRPEQNAALTVIEKTCRDEQAEIRRNCRSDLDQIACRGLSLATESPIPLKQALIRAFLAIMKTNYITLYTEAVSRHLAERQKASEDDPFFAALAKIRLGHLSNWIG